MFTRLSFHRADGDYAKAIAQLIFFGIQTPCVFGLYAAWGTGKSFTMNKVITAVQCMYLEQLVDANVDTTVQETERDDCKQELGLAWLHCHNIGGEGRAAHNLHQ